MKKAQLEKLIASVDIESLAPLNEEERTALQQFEDCKKALSQLEAEKSLLRKQRQREKKQGHLSSVAMTTQEKALFASRRKRIKVDLEALRLRYSEHELQDRHNYEVSGTVWTIIDDYREEGHLDHYFSRESLEHNLFNILHLGASVLEVFVNGRRLSKAERDEFMAPMIQEEEEHRASSPFHQMFGH